MVGSIRSILVCLLIPASAITAARAQETILRETPKPFVPVRAETKNELDHREALKLYGLAVLHERGNRLLEAVRLFEQASRLEPEAAPIYRALCPLYLALDRTSDGLAACRKVVELEPGDYQSWYLLARQYRSLDRRQDAVAALDRAVACPDLKERPELRAQIYFDLAVLHENALEYAAAEKAYREVAAVLSHPEALTEQGKFSPEEINAQAAETYERLGRVCLKRGRHGEAIQAFVTAQKKDASRAGRLAYNLAEVYQEQGKLDLALRSLDAYLKTQPQGTEPYERRIKLLEKSGRQGEILPGLERAAEADKFNVGLKLLLASQYAKRGQTEHAKALYQALLKQSPSPEAYRGLLSLYNPSSPADMTSVLGILEQAVEETGDKEGRPNVNPARAAELRAILLVLREDQKLFAGVLTAVRERLKNPQPLAHGTLFYLGVLATRARKLDDAATLYRACLANGGGPHQADAYDGLLQALLEDRKYEQAVEVCRQGLRIARGTNRVLFHWRLSQAFRGLGKMDEAVAEATEAVETSADVNRLGMRRFRAHILVEAERYAEASKECEAMLKEYKEAGQVRDIRYTLSAIYSAEKQLAKAEEQLQLILEQDPNDATANNDLGYLWADEGKNLAEAEKLIRKALELDRKQRTTGTAVSPDSDHDNGAYLDSLGWVLFRRGQLKDARQELEKAAALPDGKEDPVVWDHLGDVCSRLKDSATATKAWQKAAELYEDGKRRKTDDRYKEIKQKLKLQK
jgi:tetratricopeptide (TPR) repeat protein